MGRKKKEKNEEMAEAIEATEAIEAIEAEQDTNDATIEGNQDGEPDVGKKTHNPAPSPSRPADLRRVTMALDKMAKAIADSIKVVEEVEAKMKGDTLLRVWIGTRTTAKARITLEKAFRVVKGRKDHRVRAEKIAQREGPLQSPFTKRPATKKPKVEIKHNAHIFKRKTE